jgi:hypothetical protein
MFFPLINFNATDGNIMVKKSLLRWRLSYVGSSLRSHTQVKKKKKNENENTL